MELRIAGIRRATRFSPNHVDNDARILEMTGAELEKKGIIVNYYNEEELTNADINENVIFSMARSAPALKYLETLEKKGALIMNSVSGVRNCHRENMMKIITMNDVGAPRNMTVSAEDFKYADKIVSKFSTRKLWVKRDGHINHREDIAKVYSAAELGNILKEFQSRNILKASVQEHIIGDEIKFYAAPGADYWHWYYSNGSRKNKFDISLLKQYIYELAELFGLEFYGGDVIITTDGKILFIDVNDWPSFAPIRAEAAENIANIIAEKARMLTLNRSSINIIEEF